MVETVSTQVLTGSGGTPNGAKVTVANDVWTWGGQAQQNAGSLFVQSQYGSSTLKTQIDYKPDSLIATLSGTQTFGNLVFAGAVNSSGLMTGAATASIGNSSLSFSTQAGFGYSYNFGYGIGSFTANLNSSSNSWNLGFKDTNNKDWGFTFSSGYNPSSGWFFNTTIFSNLFL